MASASLSDSLCHLAPGMFSVELRLAPEAAFQVDLLVGQFVRLILRLTEQLVRARRPQIACVSCQQLAASSSASSGCPDGSRRLRRRQAPGRAVPMLRQLGSNGRQALTLSLQACDLGPRLGELYCLARGVPGDASPAAASIALLGGVSSAVQAVAPQPETRPGFWGDVSAASSSGSSGSALVQPPRRARVRRAWTRFFAPGERQFQFLRCAAASDCACSHLDWNAARSAASCSARLRQPPVARAPSPGHPRDVSAPPERTAAALHSRPPFAAARPSDQPRKETPDQKRSATIPICVLGQILHTTPPLVDGTIGQPCARGGLSFSRALLQLLRQLGDGAFASWRASSFSSYRRRERGQSPAASAGAGCGTPSPLSHPTARDLVTQPFQFRLGRCQLLLALVQLPLQRHSPLIGLRQRRVLAHRRLVRLVGAGARLV